MTVLVGALDTLSTAADRAPLMQHELGFRLTRCDAPDALERMAQFTESCSP